MKKSVTFLALIVLIQAPKEINAQCLDGSDDKSTSTQSASLSLFQKIIDLVKNDRLSFSPLQEKRVEAVVSLFENSVLSPVYDYIEDINDGRGYTAGKIGFTTGTGDLLLVVEEYLKLNPNPDPEWRKLLSNLQEKSDHLSGSTKGLESLPALWKKTCADPLFITAQNNITNSLYKNPAKDRMKEFGLKSALGYLIFYDTMVQHGDDAPQVFENTDPDGFSGILRRMKNKPTNEKEFVKSFLESRREVLLNASGEETRAAWRESVTRVDALLNLVEKDAWTLEGDVSVRLWNSDFKLP